MESQRWCSSVTHDDDLQFSESFKALNQLIHKIIHCFEALKTLPAAPSQSTANAT